jgi:hypothetical protein
MHNEFMHTLRSEALQGASIRVEDRAGGRRSLMLRAEDGICADVQPVVSAYTAASQRYPRCAR